MSLSTSEKSKHSKKKRLSSRKIEKDSGEVTSNPVSFNEVFDEGNHNEPNRFGKWVKYKDGGVKLSFLSKQKSIDYVLVFTRTNWFQFYEDENCVNPEMSFNLEKGTFYVRDVKKYKIVVKASDLSGFSNLFVDIKRKKKNSRKKQSILKLQCLNKLDFDELIQHLRDSKITEIKKKKKKKKKAILPILSSVQSELLNNRDALENNMLLSFEKPPMDTESSGSKEGLSDENDSSYDEEEENEGEEEEEGEEEDEDDKSWNPSALDSLDEMSKEHNRIENWGTEDVIRWANDVTVGASLRVTLGGQISSFIEKEQITGKTIFEEWEDKDDVMQFLKKSGSYLLYKDKRRIVEEVMRMKRVGYYDMKKNCILKKIIRMIRNRSTGGRIVRAHVFRLSKHLGSPEEIKKKILKILFYNNNDNNNKNKKKKQEPEEEGEEEEEEDNKNITFPVKVNIVENLKEDRHKRVRKLFGIILDFNDAMNEVASPIKKFKGTYKLMDEEATKFGIIHTSMSIGNLQLEWVDSELVIVREISSERAVLCSDVGHLTIPKHEEEKFAQKLANEIVKWNAYYKYQTIGILKKKKSSRKNLQKKILEHQDRMRRVKSSSSGLIARFAQNNNNQNTPSSATSMSMRPSSTSPSKAGTGPETGTGPKSLPCTTTTKKHPPPPFKLQKSISLAAGSSLLLQKKVRKNFDSERSKMTANCQHFVQEMLSCMNIEWEFPKRVQRFLNSVKYTGNVEKVFRFDKKFSDTFFSDIDNFNRSKEETEEEEKWRRSLKNNVFQKKKKEFRPQSHKELDWFVQGCFRINPKFENDYNGEYMLLKGFDRAYWMRFRAVEVKHEDYCKNNPEHRDEFCEKLDRVKPASRRLVRRKQAEEGKVEGSYNYRFDGCPFVGNISDSLKEM